jgi:catalase
MMSINLKAPAETAQPRLGTARTLSRLILIAIALAAAIGIFAFLGGWLTPNRLTQAGITDALEAVDGVHAGFRRNHAKGLGVSGFFESNGNGARLSKAVVFQPGRVPVIGRFSLGGGNPHADDKPDTVRGLALHFALPNGEVWRTAMINLPVFPFRTPEAFYERLVAAKPDPQTGKPDPAKMTAFLERHPETVRASAIIKSQPPSSGFENTTFHSVNAFHCTNSAGESVPVRWLVTPMQPLEKANAGAAQDKHYLFDALIASIHRQSLRWRLIVIVGQPGDPTDDATVPWPEERGKVDVGTVTLDQTESAEAGAAAELVFDPLMLPVGITPSHDPLLSARSAVYSQSFTRRASEKK